MSQNVKSSPVVVGAGKESSIVKLKVEYDIVFLLFGQFTLEPSTVKSKIIEECLYGTWRIYQEMKKLRGKWSKMHLYSFNLHGPSF